MYVFIGQMNEICFNCDYDKKNKVAKCQRRNIKK